MRQILGQLMVARLTASLRNQTGRSRGPIPGDEPLDLSSTDIESLRGSPRHQPSFDDRFDNLESIQLTHAHRDRVGVIGHERLLVDHQEPLRMNQTATNYDISKWPEHDISKKLLQI
ncbi:hypothetical protein WI86_23490 [Burkholderia ubonensis]|nr:hypothetical protein WI86_23490 [Burkholderia ubonensis]KVU84066.1 hypothetical protein WK74_15270 [Burkholderia ubonensis]